MPSERLLFIVVLPAACALIGLAIAGRPWRRLRPADPRTGPYAWAWGGAAGFGLGFVLATWQIVGRWPVLRESEGWLPYSPTAGEDWIPYLVVLAAAVGVSSAFHRPPLWARVLIRAIVSIAAVALVLNWRISDRFWSTPQEVALALALLGGAVFLIWSSISALAERSEGAPLPVALWAGCSGAAVTIILARNATFAEQFGALAACLGSAFVLSLWRSDLTLARGPAPVIAVAYASLLGAAYYTMDHLWWPAALLLAAAPSAAWVLELRPIRRKGAVARSLIGLASTALPTAAAAIIVYLSRPEASPYPY